MICKNCGATVENGSQFCTNCGTPVPMQEMNNYQPPVQDYGQPPVYEEPKPTSDNKILVLGIIAVALARISRLGVIPYSVFAYYGIFGIPAIILGSLALKSATDYELYCGALTRKARIGRILGKVALIVGIVTCSFFAIYLLLTVILIFGFAGNQILSQLHSIFK